MGSKRGTYIDFGALAALGVFANLFGLVLGTMMIAHCQVLKTIHVSGDDMARAMQSMALFHTCEKVSFVAGVVLMASSVIAATFSEQNRSVAVIISTVAGFLALVLIVFEMIQRSSR